MPRALVFLAMSAFVASATAQAVTAERQAELRDLVHQDCGACHGKQRTGGLGPAWTAQAMKGKNHRFRFATIREGRPGTPMPPWQPLLTDPEINWIVDYLKTPEPNP